MTTSTMATVPTPIKALLAAALLLFVGAIGLKRLGADGRADPIASVDNGGPRGLLLLQLALERAGLAPTRVDSDRAFAAATAGDDVTGLVVLVPPPEQSPFTVPEAAGLVRLAERGAVVVVICDPDEGRQKRLRRVTDPLGVKCLRAPEGTPPVTVALGAPRDATLFVRDRGRVALTEDAGFGVPLSAVDEGGTGHAVAVAFERGVVVVLGSASALTNDGLTEASNLAFLLTMIGARSRVVVDERHHLSRGAAAVQKAVLQGTGPVTALLCALLLVPIALLGFSPRRGELTRSDVDVTVPAGQARVRGLAALLADGARGGTATTTTSRPTDRSRP